MQIRGWSTAGCRCDCGEFRQRFWEACCRLWIVAWRTTCCLSVFALHLMWSRQMGIPVMLSSAMSQMLGSKSLTCLLYLWLVLVMHPGA